MPDYSLIEKQELKRIGAKPQPNSGRGKHKKADGIWHNFVVDVKYTERSLTLNEKVWSKVCSDAAQVNPMFSPMLLVNMSGVRLAIIPLDELIDMVESNA